MHSVSLSLMVLGVVMGETLLQEDLIAKLGQDGAGNSRHGNQAGPAAEKLLEQVQADVSYCQLDCHWAPS